MATEYKIISADSHLETDPANWVKRVPEKHRDRAPRRIRTETGGDAILVEGATVREVPSDLYGGKGRDRWRPYGQRYEDTPGTGSGEQRVREMLADGIDAEVMYPAQASGPNFWRSIKDDAPYLAVIQAYNSWLAEEYCAADPQRLIGLGIMPMTTIDDVLSEVQRCKEMGLKGALLSAFPSNKPHPTPDDDRFWAACRDLQMPVTVHIELNRNGPRSGPLMAKQLQQADISSHVDYPGQVSRFYRAGGLNAVQWILDGTFDRFPELKIYFAETHCGWIPVFYHMSDLRWSRHHWWAEELEGYKPLSMKPSEYMREHVYWGFLDDPIGVEMRHHIRTDRMMWATDFPHQESEWPHSTDVIGQIMHGVPENEQYLMVAGNCIEFFHLDAAAPGRETAGAAATAR